MYLIWLFSPLTPKSAHWKVNIIYLSREVHVQVNPREGLQRLGNEYFFAQVGSLFPPSALTALCCVRIKEKPSVGCKQHLFPHCCSSMLSQQCKSLYCWSAPEHQQQKHTNPSKGTATPVSGHLTHAGHNSTPSNRVRYPWRSTFISGQICPPCVYNPRHRGWPQSPLQNQLHDHTSSKAAPRGADTAEPRRPEHAWTHGGG